MLYQYHCACCNHTLASSDKECPQCGSHHIRSPYGFWMFCLAACLAVAGVFHVSNIDHSQPETPKPPSLINALKS